MTRTHLLSALALAALAGAAHAQPVAFTQWNFNAIATNQIVNNPRPSTGQGLAVPLGMTNNYRFATSPVRTGSFTMCDVTSAGASGDTASSPNNCWRVRGSFDQTLANAGIGWSIFAPQFTQGAEFDVSTVNYAGITFNFDWFTTNQGVRNMQVQYSTDAGTTWTSIGPVRTSATNGWINNISIDFTSISAADDNPNFRVRLVSVYDPTYTGPGAPTYTGASGGQYNNSSGNWRFDRVTFTGTAIRSVAPAATGSVNPPAVCSSGGQITLGVTAQSGAGPASTGLTVTADLSSLGLSATQAFFDDGSSGDAVAGDGVYSFTATVPAGRPLGTTNITATVADAQLRSGSTTIPVIVADCDTTSASRVVISQAFGGGGNLGVIPAEDGPYDADFVELYNRSNQTVSLDGWSVQYASQGSITGFDNPGDQVLLSGSILPGQHLLVRMSDPTPGFTPLPTPDFAQLPGFGGMGNTGGRVALVRSTTLLGTNFADPSVEDFLGYGTAALAFEGSAPAPTPVPANAKCVARKNSGAQDTNQNFNDFALTTPSARNRASDGFLAGYASVSTGAACAGSDVTLNVAVFPGSGSTGIAVNADVSDLVGSPASAQLFDDGTHGDTFPADGIFSTTYSIPGGATQGNHTIGFTVTDAQGRSDTSSKGLAVGTCTRSSAPVVISRVYGGGGNASSGYNGDFAEIFNRSQNPVDLTGWSFQSARISDAGFDSRICLLSGVINPGEYRLIVTNQPSQTGAALPGADFTPSTLFGMESSFGRVALLSTTDLLHADYSRADVVDLVGYGSASQSFEGVGPAATLGDILVAIRKDGGCQDNNQNAIDFDVVLALELPHNGGSPTHVCPPPPPPACRADFNGDSDLNPDDLGDFITCYFTEPPCNGADFNTDSDVNPDDLGDFITAYFQGC